MTPRIVFELIDSVEEAPDSWSRIASVLRKAGASTLRPPTSGPPFIGTAVLAEDTDVQDVLRRLRETSGIVAADEDAWREMF